MKPPTQVCRFEQDQEAFTIAIGIPRLARRGSIVVAVAMLAMAGLAGAPAVAQAQFPVWIPMANTPSGVAVDKSGNLYVTESFSMSAAGYGEGGIWPIPPRGAAKLWVRHPLLTGIGLSGNPPMGASGIACYHGDLFVTNLGWTVRFIPGKWPGAALVKVAAGAPGRPLK